MRSVIFAVVLLSLTIPLPAQITFQRAYGGEDFDGGRSVLQTADGGYIVTGYTRSFGAGQSDVWLLKTDAFGDTIWTQTYGGTESDYGYSVRQTTDGGYVITGYTYSFGAGYSNVWLIRTDASGDTVWTRTFGGEDSDGGRSVAQTTDGGYIVAGRTCSFGAGLSDVWLIKTDASGDSTWTRTYGGEGFDYGRSVAQTADGGYIITGYTTSFGAGSSDVYLVKTDASGDTIWTRTFGGTNWDDGYSVAQTTDGGYILAGVTESFDAGSSDVYLVKTDASGDTIWTRTFGGAKWDDGYSVAQTTDGGYIVTGYTHSIGAGWVDVWLIKTDASGNTIWTRTYGGTDYDCGYSVAQTTDGGYVIAGWTWSFGARNPDVYLIKTDSAGNCAAIAEPEPPVTHKPAGATIARAVLYVPGTSGVLLDIAGREVMDLQPGDNDVRHLTPGVYFVRPAGTVLRAKVILTR